MDHRELHVCHRLYRRRVSPKENSEEEGGRGEGCVWCILMVVCTAFGQVPEEASAVELSKRVIRHTGTKA